MAPRPDYRSGTYETADRWINYGRQVREVLAFRPASVLEIGKGSGAVSSVLKARGLQVTTLDTDAANAPDIVASVTAMPVADASFDVVLCAEVLEHLPYGEFPKALSELRRAARKGVVLSLPHWGWTFRFLMKVPLLPKLEWFWKLDGLKAHPPGGEHFWEIGKRGYPPRRIRATIAAAGFRIVREVFQGDDPYHRFFILEKT
jgi:ubiquinone/menaquinone biosynthesis C-methylase UbiE